MKCSFPPCPNSVPAGNTFDLCAAHTDWMQFYEWIAHKLRVGPVPLAEVLAAGAKYAMQLRKTEAAVTAKMVDLQGNPVLDEHGRLAGGPKAARPVQGEKI